MDNETILSSSLQSTPQTAKNVTKAVEEKVHPITQLPRPIFDEAPIEFELEGRNDSFIDVKNIQMFLTCKVKKRKADGTEENLDTELKEGETQRRNNHVVPYPGLLYALFSDVQIEYQHKPLYSSQNYYDTKTFIHILTSVPVYEKETSLKNALWYRDKRMGRIGMIEANSSLAPMETMRNQATRDPIYLNGRLITDLFNVSRPLVDGVTVNIRFYPNKPNKCLHCDDEGYSPAFEISDFTLLVPRIYPKPSLLKQPAVYPWVHTHMQRHIIPKGAKNFGPKNILTTDCLPRRCIVFLWSEEQLEGDYKEIRHDLQHYGVESICAKVNGEDVPRYGGLTGMDYERGLNYGQVYQNILDQVGWEGCINFGVWNVLDGCTLYPFDLTQKRLSPDYYSPKKAGTIDLIINFKVALPKNTVVMVMFEDERIIKVDKMRQVTNKPAM